MCYDDRGGCCCHLDVPPGQTFPAKSYKPVCTPTLTSITVGEGSYTVYAGAYRVNLILGRGMSQTLQVVRQLSQELIAAQDTLQISLLDTLLVSLLDAPQVSLLVSLLMLRLQSALLCPLPLLLQ